MPRIAATLIPLLIVTLVATAVVVNTTPPQALTFVNHASPSAQVNFDNNDKLLTPAEPTMSAAIESREFVPPPLSRNFNYCIRLKDVPDSYAADLAAKLASVYSDPRGWSLGGAITFTHNESNCSYTVTLAAAADLPSFNSICSTVWSCEVGTNVIINFDRWSQGSPTWPGPLDDYRTLVINHETGHFLGFGHLHCPGPGLPAPVMQQQSIDLEGCVVNSWPLPSERQTLANRYGIKL